MKRYLLIIGFSFTITFLLAQAPEAINYQAVIRGSNGLLLSNHSVNIRISLLEDNIAGNVVYSENHSTATNVLGIVNLAIGNGTVITGTFDSIDWSGSYHYIKIEVDTAGGTNYYHMGTSQLLSVPYSLESKHAGNASSLTLTDENGNKYEIKVDTAGNLYTEVIDTLPPIPVNGLVAWYPFNGNANDESGNGNDGIVNGATLTPDRFGNMNSAYYLDGLNDYLYAPFNYSFSSVSISFWYNASSPTSTWPTFFYFVQSANINNHVFYSQLRYFEGDPGNLFTRLVTSPNNTFYDLVTLNPPSLNAWHHVCCVFNKSINTFFVYLDGVLIGQIGTIGDFLPCNQLNIGTHDPAFNYEWFNGSLDDYRIYNRALTQDEILALYNESSQWTCGDTLVDTRDGQEYPTVQIGSQCWMTKNMNIGTMILSTMDGYQQTDNDIFEKYCYINILSQCDIYGGLYEWDEAMQYNYIDGSQGICPDGWHIPSNGEWNTLVTFLDDGAGGKLKSTGTIEEGTGLWYAPNTGATNESGFSGLPGGGRSYFLSISFFGRGLEGHFWTSTLEGSESAFHRALMYNNSGCFTDGEIKSNGYSVRCVRYE